MAGKVVMVVEEVEGPWAYLRNYLQEDGCKTVVEVVVAVAVQRCSHDNTMVAASGVVAAVDRLVAVVVVVAEGAFHTMT